MAYVKKTDVTGKIPPQFLTDALDDDGDGVEDAGLFDQIVATASNDIDGFLSGIFSVPFEDPQPAPVRAAALVFVCEAIYARRLTPDQRNPFGAQANFWRDRLQKISKREIALDAGDEGEPVAGAKSGSNAVVPGRLSAFLLLLFLIWGQSSASAATLSGVAYDASGNPISTNITFRAQSTPIVFGSGVASSFISNVVSDASGNYSVNLIVGAYKVTQGANLRDSFTIVVSNNALVMNITNCITSPIFFTGLTIPIGPPGPAGPPGTGGSGNVSPLTNDLNAAGFKGTNFNLLAATNFNGGSFAGVGTALQFAPNNPGASNAFTWTDVINDLADLNTVLAAPAAGQTNNGQNLTNLNAAELRSGTVADARLSANVPLLNASNVFGSGISNSGGFSVAGGSYFAGTNTAQGWNFTSNVSYTTMNGKMVTIATSNIDASIGTYFKKTLAANTPFVLSGLSEGTTIQIKLANPGTFVTTWTGFTWATNDVPPLPTPMTSIISVTAMDGTNYAIAKTNYP